MVELVILHKMKRKNLHNQVEHSYPTATYRKSNDDPDTDESDDLVSSGEESCWGSEQTFFRNYSDHLSIKLFHDMIPAPGEYICEKITVGGVTRNVDLWSVVEYTYVGESEPFRRFDKVNYYANDDDEESDNASHAVIHDLDCNETPNKKKPYMIFCAAYDPSPRRILTVDDVNIEQSFVGFHNRKSGLVLIPLTN